jgi:hypothetical protein
VVAVVTAEAVVVMGAAVLAEAVVPEAVVPEAVVPGEAVPPAGILPEAPRAAARTWSRDTAEWRGLPAWKAALLFAPNSSAAPISRIESPAEKTVTTD